jgi:hypothetical protein
MKKLLLFLLIAVISVTTNAQDSLQQYVGKYIFPDGSVVPDVEVTINDGALIMSSVAGISSLVRSGVDSFTVTEFSGLAVFKRGDDKKVIGVYIDAAGYILEGKKQDNGIWTSVILKKEDSLSIFD